MTTEEKRIALIDECDRHGECASCKGWKTGLCKDYDIVAAPPEVIDRWYAEVYPKAESTPTIKDSGERREFASGAVRDIQEGKGRCDLLPLDAVARHCGKILESINEFQETGNAERLHIAIQQFVDTYMGKDLANAMLEVAVHFEDGAKKYGDRNWQKGIPARCYVDSAVRHYLKFRRGDKDERHDRAFLWNLLCCIWTCKHHPELNDYAKENVKHGEAKTEP